MIQSIKDIYRIMLAADSYHRDEQLPYLMHVVFKGQSYKMYLRAKGKYIGFSLVKA